MRRITISIIIIILISLPVLSKDDQTTYDSYDLAPGAEPGYSQPSDEQWDLQYSWIFGDSDFLGIAFDGEYLWVSGRGIITPTIYIFNPDPFELVHQFPASAPSAWGVRDLCFDGTYMYGGWDQGLNCWDIETYDLVTTIPFPAGMSFQRANAYDPATDHFYCGNFSGTCYEQDRDGNLIRMWNPAPLTAIYGMAWDDEAPDGPWLWVHDQANPVGGCNVHQVDPITLTLTGFNITLNIPGAGSLMAGGLDYTSHLDPCFTSMLVMGQGYLNSAGAFEMYQGGLPTAPAAPTDFSVTANGADLSANLNWTNPSMTYGGEPLLDLDGIRIYREGGLIADLADVQIGEPGSYTDDSVPLAGMYNYQLSAYNDWGEGPPAYGSGWIGLDVPSAPDSLEVIPDPTGLLEAALSWDEPASGAHGGYFSGTDSYNIYRAPQGEPLELVTAGVIGAAYIDNDPDMGWNVYGVSGVNSSGEGPIAECGPVFVGPPEFEQIPYDWFEIAHIGTNTGITGDDQNLGPFDMGFAFPWLYGNYYSSIRVCSNGFLSFTSTSTDYSNNPIPDNPEPNNVVAPYWDDFNPSGTNYGEYYYYQDTANNRFIVQFDSLNHYGNYTGDYFTFQAIFHTNGDIIFQYRAIEPGTMTEFPSATAGIENEDGTEGIQITYNGSGPFEPASETAVIIHYVSIPPLPEIELVLTPTGLPIVIPAGGGNFEFNISATNLEPVAFPTDIWTNVTMPGGSIYGPIINVPGLMMPAAVTIDRDRVQAVPAGAPAGIYSYNAYAGIYPYLTYGEDHFVFEKSAMGDGTGYQEWYNWGEAFPGEVLNAPDLPVDYSLCDAYPNPFNPAAHIGYTLPERAQVELIVYDVSGREVTSLVKGWKDAGTYEVAFDGSGMASGVYFYRLTAGDFSEVKKMILVK